MTPWGVTIQPEGGTDPRLVISLPILLGFAYGATSTLFVQLFGQLYVFEIIAVLVIFIVGPKRIARGNPAMVVITAGYTMMLSGLIAADILNYSTTGDALRGWANVAFALADAVFLAYLLRLDLKVLLWVLAGSALARIIHSDVNDLTAALDGGNAFKTSVAPIITPLLLILAYHADRLKMGETLLLLVGLVYVVLGARSAGLMFVGAGGLLLLLRVRRGGQRLCVSLLLLAGAYAMYIVYVDYIMSSGVAGNAYDQLVRAANPYNPLSLLAEGRAEVRVAMAAISESPFLGRGSWAQDSDGYFSMLQADLTGASQVYYNPLIAAHSVVLTAWLWGGLMGLIGILLVCGTTIWRGVAALSVSRSWRPLVAFLLIEFAWNSLFSPIGHIRASFPIAIATIIVLTGRARLLRGRIS